MSIQIFSKTNKFFGMLVINWILWEILGFWLILLILIVASGLPGGSSSSFEQSLETGISQQTIFPYLDNFLFLEVGDQIAAGFLLFILLIIIASIVITYKIFWNSFSNKIKFLSYFVVCHVVIILSASLGIPFLVPGVLTLLLIALSEIELFGQFAVLSIFFLHLVSYPLVIYLLFDYIRRPAFGDFYKKSKSQQPSIGSVLTSNNVSTQNISPVSEENPFIKNIFRLTLPILICVIISLVLSGICSVIYQKDVKKEKMANKQELFDHSNQKIVDTPTPSPTPAPTMYPLPSLSANRTAVENTKFYVDLSAVRSFQILNGQGEELVEVIESDSAKPLIRALTDDLIVTEVVSRDTYLSSWKVMLNVDDIFTVQIDEFSRSTYLKIIYGREENESQLLTLEYIHIPIEFSQDASFMLSPEGISPLTLDYEGIVRPSSSFESK